MMKKISRRDFMKVLGVAGAACAMTALTGCDGSGTIPAGDGSIPLSYLKPFDGAVGWNNTKSPEDPFGNVYTSGVNYSRFSAFASGWEKYTWGPGDYRADVEYDVNKRYKKLTMKLNPYKTMGTYGWAKVNVYADGKLVATSPVIEKKTRESVKFEVAIQGAEYIVIEPIVSKISGEYNGDLLMWDVKLWR